MHESSVFTVLENDKRPVFRAGRTEFYKGKSVHSLAPLFLGREKNSAEIKVILIT
jgi:hypothetical protein